MFFAYLNDNNMKVRMVSKTVFDEDFKRENGITGNDA
jgi:hypothetical protein